MASPARFPSCAVSNYNREEQQQGLNKVLRRLAALQLASNSYMLLAYVAGSDNPADEPSRFFDAQGTLP